MTNKEAFARWRCSCGAPIVRESEPMIRGKVVVRLVCEKGCMISPVEARRLGDNDVDNVQLERLRSWAGKA